MRRVTPKPFWTHTFDLRFLHLSQAMAINLRFERETEGPGTRGSIEAEKAGAIEDGGGSIFFGPAVSPYHPIGLSRRYADVHRAHKDCTLQDSLLKLRNLP